MPDRVQLNQHRSSSQGSVGVGVGGVAVGLDGGIVDGDGGVCVGIDGDGDGVGGGGDRRQCRRGCEGNAAERRGHHDFDAEGGAVIGGSVSRRRTCRTGMPTVFSWVGEEECGRMKRGVA